MASFKKSFLSSSKWIASISISQNVLSFLFGIILARLLTPEIFGEFATILATVEILSIITGIGINTSIIQNHQYDEVDFTQVGFSLSIWLLIIYASFSAIVGLFFFRQALFVFTLIVLFKILFLESSLGIINNPSLIQGELGCAASNTTSECKPKILAAL